jgi:hypothetical protein
MLPSASVPLAGICHVGLWRPWWQSDQIDGFLKAHDVWIDYTLQDLERERAGLQRLGF